MNDQRDMNRAAVWPSISVVIPTYRRYRPTLSTLRDLLAQDYPEFEIVVADQNPTWPAEFQSELDTLKANHRVRWLTLETPGVVAARNEAVRVSTGEILVFVDDDVEIRDKSFLRRHAWNYRDARVAAVAGRECSAGASTQFSAPRDEDAPPLEAPQFSGESALQQVLAFNREGSQRQWAATFCTCNASIRRGVFLAVNGFDENFSGNSYGDDYDLAIRLHEAGHRIIFDPAAGLVHLQTPMGGLRLSDASNSFNEFDRALSSWIFLLRHGTKRTWPSLFYRHLLRKTVLLKRNVVRPWRQFPVCAGVVRAFFEARRRVRGGPRSRFGTPGHEKSESRRSPQLTKSVGSTGS
jgi:GT2 family glycosyltransferase